MNRRFGIMGWTVLLLTPLLLNALQAQSGPGSLADAEIERQKILKAADQMEVLTHKIESMQLEVNSLRDSISKLEAENKGLRSELTTMKKDSTREREALLNEVGKILSEGTGSGAGTGVATPQQTDGYEHVVQKGQSLWAIADAFQKQGIKVTVDDIRKANKLKEGGILKVGQKLFIPKK
jgi:LysM repeat protein